MTDQVTVIFDDTVWHDVLRARSLPSPVAVSPAAWERLTRAAPTSHEKPTPMETRVATFTPAQAKELEGWLGGVAGRADAPASLGQALAMVREGIRLAQ